MTAHATAAAYNAGCRCGKCREAHRQRLRDYRASKRREPAPLPESVVAAVREDLAGLPDVPASTAATALALARVLDDETAGAAARLLRTVAAGAAGWRARHGSAHEPRSTSARRVVTADEVLELCEALHPYPTEAQAAARGRTARNRR